MFNLNFLTGEKPHEEPAPADPLEPLLAEAKRMVAEWAQVISTTEKAEAALAECEEGVRAAAARVAGEEYEAAQAEGALAVASVAAQDAKADAELRVKSIRLRLQGLQADKARETPQSWQRGRHSQRRGTPSSRHGSRSCGRPSMPR